MALPAGRVGVDPSQVDSRGKVKINTQSEIPPHTSQESGKYLSVDENGDLIWSEKTGGGVESGTAAPTAVIGNNGDIYIQYDALAPVAGGYALPEYVVSSTTQRLSTHAMDFYKTYEGAAIAVESLQNGYYGPILVSRTSDFTIYTDNSYVVEHDIDGVIWYISGVGQSFNKNPDDPTIPRLNLTENRQTEGTLRKILSVSQYTTEQSYILKAVWEKINGIWQIWRPE